jgi:hypothetical protein
MTTKSEQEDIGHLNRSITNNEIEIAIKCLQKKKSPGPHLFSADFYQTYKSKLIPSFLNLFHEIEVEGTMPNHYIKPVLPSPPNQTRTHPKGELQANFLNEHQCKNPQLNNGKPNPTTFQKDHSP